MLGITWFHFYHHPAITIVIVSDNFDTYLAFLPNTSMFYPNPYILLCSLLIARSSDMHGITQFNFYHDKKLIPGWVILSRNHATLPGITPPFQESRHPSRNHLIEALFGSVCRRWSGPVRAGAVGVGAPAVRPPEAPYHVGLQGIVNALEICYNDDSGTVYIWSLEQKKCWVVPGVDWKFGVAIESAPIGHKIRLSLYQLCVFNPGSCGITEVTIAQALEHVIANRYTKETLRYFMNTESDFDKRASPPTSAELTDAIYRWAPLDFGEIASLHIENMVRHGGVRDDITSLKREIIALRDVIATYHEFAMEDDGCFFEDAYEWSRQSVDDLVASVGIRPVVWRGRGTGGGGKKGIVRAPSPRIEPEAYHERDPPTDVPAGSRMRVPSPIRMRAPSPIRMPVHVPAPAPAPVPVHAPAPFYVGEHVARAPVTKSCQGTCMKGGPRYCPCKTSERACT